MQSRVQHEVRLDDSSHSLAGLVEEASAPNRYSALEAVLQRGEKVVKRCRCPSGLTCSLTLSVLLQQVCRLFENYFHKSKVCLNVRVPAES